MTPFTATATGGAHAADRDEVRRALAVLIDPNQTFELRGLPSGRSRICTGADLEAAVEAAWDLSDGTGVFRTLNPVRPDLDRPAKDPDILVRREILIDCDSIREPNTNATDAERGAAIDKACDVAAFLTERQWADPVMIDSGNGAHLNYRIDLPNDKLSRLLVRDVLVELAKQFDDDKVKVDQTVHNASRIAKLPGTWARKGPETPDRPHRMARLIYVPSTIGVVTTEQLVALARPPKPELNGHARAPFQAVATNESLHSYVRSAIDRECARVRWATPGAGEGRNNALNRAAFSLGTLSQWPEMDSVGAKRSLRESALQAGLGENETDKTLRSGWEAGSSRPRDRPVESGRNGVASKIIVSTGSFIIWAKDVTPRKVEWLWPGRIPIGKMTTFAGQTGMGKTFTLCDIAARITCGAEIPFGGGECFQQGKVLIISAEDDADDTIVPRFIELKGDRSRLAFLSPEAEDRFSLSALELLNHSLDQMDGDVRMVAIDPPTSYLGRTDDHKNAELRGLLAPLRRWSIQRRIALVFVTHVNKAGGMKVDAMARVMGSVAWVAAVRAAHMFCPDPHDKSRSLFIPLKVNNAAKGKGIAYRIMPVPDDMATIEWLEEVDTTADEAMHQESRQAQIRSASEVLAEMFTQQKQWSSDLFWAHLREQGVTNYEFKKAKPRMDIPKARRAVGSTGDVVYTWWVPDDWPHFLNSE